MVDLVLLQYYLRIYAAGKQAMYAIMMALGIQIVLMITILQSVV